MGSVLAIIPVAAGAYVATNLDNFTLLVALLARYRHKVLQVIAGYMTSMLILVAIAYWASTAASAMPVEYLGLLGIVPISVGAVGLVRLFRGHTAKSTIDQIKSTAGKSVIFTTLAVQLGNGADTLVTISALFADSNPSADVLAVVTLAAMALLFVFIAVYAVKHPALTIWIDRNADRITPFILIIVGTYILLNTATDILPA
jgi:cadmium resistance protein CadD (predicted permease)